MTVLSVSDLSLAFGVHTVLDGVSFSLNETDKLGVIGVNGCGKSTLFKLITGELTPDQGNVFIGGLYSVQRNPIRISTQPSLPALTLSFPI